MMAALIHFSFKKVVRGFECLMTSQTWLGLSGFKDLFVALLIQKWRRCVHVPCLAGRRHPSPGLSVALARTPVEPLSPAVPCTELWQIPSPSVSLHSALQYSPSCTEGTQCTILQSSEDSESRHTNSQVSPPSSQFTAVVSTAFGRDRQLNYFSFI